MDLPGSAYLYTVATVSVTFVGFSALAMLFRQTVGTEITSYDSFFTITFMQTGFMVTAGALLPPLLALYELSSDFVWRWSSAITAIPIFLFVFTFPGRRRKVTSRSASAFVWMLLLLQLISGLYLVFNAIGNPVRTGGGRLCGRDDSNAIHIGARISLGACRFVSAAREFFVTRGLVPLHGDYDSLVWGSRVDAGSG
jgi:hypothetical protein